MEKSAIQDRYYQLDQEILDSAKKWNVDLTNKKVTFQKNLSQILGKRKQEEVIFDEEKRAFLFEDDPLYARAKESGNQELLEKFHNRSLTRNEYEKASEHYEVEKRIDYYYDTPARFDKIGEYNEYGLAIVEENGKKGLINKNGEVIGEIKYKDIGKFNEYGVAIVEFGESRLNKHYNIINIIGEELCKCGYDKIWEFNKDGVAIVHGFNTRNFPYSHDWLIDIEGNSLFPCEFGNIIEVINKKSGTMRVRNFGESILLNSKGEKLQEFNRDHKHPSKKKWRKFRK